MAPITVSSPVFTTTPWHRMDFSSHAYLAPSLRHAGGIEGEVLGLEVVRVGGVGLEGHRDALPGQGGVVHLQRESLEHPAGWRDHIGETSGRGT